MKDGKAGIYVKTSQNVRNALYMKYVITQETDKMIKGSRQYQDQQERLSARKCKRCGKCCTYTFDGKEYRCKYLEGKIQEGVNKTKYGGTTCSIYNKRIGTIIATHIAPDGSNVEMKCDYRRQSRIKIEGCDVI